MSDLTITLADLAERARVLTELLRAAQDAALPAPGSASVQYAISLTADTPEQVAAWAAFLGDNVHTWPHEDAVQHRVDDGRFGGQRVTVCAIVRERVTA